MPLSESGFRFAPSMAKLRKCTVLFSIGIGSPERVIVVPVIVTDAEALSHCRLPFSNGCAEVPPTDISPFSLPENVAVWAGMNALAADRGSAVIEVCMSKPDKESIVPFAVTTGIVSIANRALRCCRLCSSVW